MLQTHLKSPLSARISSVTVTSNAKGNQNHGFRKKNTQSLKTNAYSCDLVQSNSKHQGKRQNGAANENNKSGDPQEVKDSIASQSKHHMSSCAIDKGMPVERTKGRKRNKRTRGRKATENNMETQIINLKPGSKVFLEQEADQGPLIASGPFIVDEVLKDYIILKCVG